MSCLAPAPLITDVALRTARLVFKKRGNHGEAHLDETELYIILEAAIRWYEERKGRLK